ncbi:MAG: MraY family glycosyltransferase [Chromatiaceae bacterium]
MLCTVGLGIAFITSALVMAALHFLAPRIGLMDHPNKRRKAHRHPVPLTGGIAIFSGLVAGALGSLTLETATLHGLLGAAVILLVGGLDDRFEVPTHWRLLGQVAAALILVLGAGVEIDSLGDLLGMGPIETGPLAILFTVVAIVGIINAFNMIDGIDGIDGLTGGLAFIVLGILSILTWAAGGDLSFLLLAVMVAIIPFLACNLELWRRGCSKAFLGDGGSMLLGYIVVWALIEATQTQGAIAPVTALWLVGIPLLDILATMVRRLIAGKSPFSADRGHLHHLLSRLFGSARIALALILLGALLLAGIGLAGEHLGLAESVMFGLALLVFLGYLWMTRIIRCSYRALRRQWRHAHSQIFKAAPAGKTPNLPGPRRATPQKGYP